MIYGIGTDIVEVLRFSNWKNDEKKCKRFFNELELNMSLKEEAFCQSLAARYAAKEAFSKALGTGLCGFDLKDICVEKNDEGKPFISLYNKAADTFIKRCGKGSIHLSLSHEKGYAIAFVVIEKE